MHIAVWIIMLIELFPLYMMLQISFKDNAEFLQNPWLPSAISGWHWENWAFGFKLILPYVANTVFVAVAGTAIGLGFAVMGAYFFARYKMPFSGVLWSAFLLLMLMPGVANIVPLFALLKSLNLLNTLWALVILGVSGVQVFNIYVSTQLHRGAAQGLVRSGGNGWSRAFPTNPQHRHSNERTHPGNAGHPVIPQSME